MKRRGTAYPHRTLPLFLVPRARLLVLLLGMAFSATLPSFPSLSLAQTFINDAFQPTTPVEILTAPFTAEGTTTANEYTGLVEILVSGFGQGSGAMVNDAFYFFESSPGNPILPQSLSGNPACCSFLRLSLEGSACFPAPPIDQFIVFIDGVGPVSKGTIPEFSADHVYHLVIDLGSSQGRLTLGNMDCGFWDNTGSFEIHVNGVEPVPPDRDKDGVVDTLEACFCLNTPSGQEVTTLGCSVEQLCPCEAPLGRASWQSHREYVKCVRGVTAELVAEGVLTKPQRKKLIRRARGSDCGE